MKNSIKSQRGASLTEFLLGSALFGAAMIPTYQWLSRSQEQTDLSITAQHHSLVLQAASEYLKENRATILATATATTPAKVTIADLITAKKLPSGYSAVNNFGQTQCILVLEPTPHTPAMLVVSEGGTALTDGQLSAVVEEVGASGGGIYARDSTAATGAAGGWAIDATTTPKLADFLKANCSGTTASAGHLASSLYYSDSTLSTNYLHRSNDPGRTDQTKMVDPLGLAVRVKSSACDGTDENGRLAVDSNNQVLSCQNNGGWKWDAVGGGYWKDPAANYISLPSSGNTTGDVRLTLDTRRAFSWSGAAWTALAVDQNGNMTVPGALTVNGTTIQGDGGTNSWIKQNGTLNVTNAAATAFTDLKANDITTTGRLTAEEFLQLNTVVTENTACSPNGLVSRDANGLILSCQSGRWAKQGVAIGKVADPIKVSELFDSKTIIWRGASGYGNDCTTLNQYYDCMRFTVDNSGKVYQEQNGASSYYICTILPPSNICNHPTNGSNYRLTSIGMIINGSTTVRWGS